MTTFGRLPAVGVAAPVKVWSAGAVDEQGAGAAVERRGLADRPRAATVPVVDVAVGQGQARRAR